MSKSESKRNFTEYLKYITSTWEVRLRHGDASRPCNARGSGECFYLSPQRCYQSLILVLTKR
jgi:hypothetical protein